MRHEYDCRQAGSLVKLAAVASCGHDAHQQIVVNKTAKD